MGSDARQIEELVRQLSPTEQRAVLGFIEQLLSQHKERPPAKLHLSWAGALADLGEKSTSVELQHQISRWRIDGE